MAKKRSAQADADTSKPKQLRKRLRKAEDQLADAVSKRDRAQARVEALSIIADEIRAQLADADKAAEETAAVAASAAAAEAAGAPQKPVAATRKPVAAAGKPGRKRKAPPATEPVAASQDPAGGAPAQEA